MGKYSIQHQSAKSVDAYLLFLCLVCDLYDTITSNAVSRLFLINSINSFNISKLNVKFQYQFTAPFQKHQHTLFLCTLSILILPTYTDKHVGKTF